jgi:hypothetical protein
MNRRSFVPGMALLAGLLLTHAASASTAYYVSATDVYVRSHAEGYAMGRLYSGERMDILHVNSNGWAFGYAHGNVNRCVWVQYSTKTAVNFWTHGTVVGDPCGTQPRNLQESEFTNGELWGRGTNDGVFQRLARDTETWDNWVWGGRWGNNLYRGVSRAGSLWKIRYTTVDGGGVMARPCTEAGGNVSCSSDWYFIQRSAFDTIPCGTLGSNQSLYTAWTLNSCDGRFSLTVQSDHNLVLYHYLAGAIWTPYTVGTGANRLTMQSDGNLVLYNSAGGPVWHTNTAGQWGSTLRLQNDGNMVVYNAGGAAVWNSGTCCR